ncbi:hypothetical protein DAPPUDRAFT_246340 [Daphnia pulex]|uniref:Uncharacterized protein n=1 Tax=Daphnia pulex TaxID=6669 RepID=E9GQ86_DAPPU|nr:hypothetical protein DAPPUDRAFT_246340 [Daphnia pulex]|eukprot:EFX78387.1 hypothetical protein DAPPUDRAFT_246340 [Daphnia pulex]
MFDWMDVKVLAGQLKGLDWPRGISDVASSPCTGRQLAMPAIYPSTAGLLMNYQQRSHNFYDQWLHASFSISSDGWH